MASSLLRCLLLSALTMPLLAHAQVYKWVDQRGVTNYGEKPPGNVVNVTTVEADSNLSTIPLAIPQRPSRPGDATWEARAAMWEARAAQLERNAAIAGSLDRQILVGGQDPAAWRERCFAELRVDCLRPTPATYDYIPSFNPSDFGSPFRPGRF